MHDEPQYLGRQQQGTELLLVLQCVDSADKSEDPADVPVCSIYRDGASPTLIETVDLAADLRGVLSGLFRRPLFLGDSYGTAGRHLLVYRWVDGAGRARQRVGSFYLLPGGSPDGAVIAVTYLSRPDARYLLYQTDGGQIIRGRNPR